MKTINVKINPARLAIGLASVTVGARSSAVFTICGNVPNDLRGISILFERTALDGVARAPVMCSGELQTDGTWRVYCPALTFSDIADDLKYQVIGIDEMEDKRWLGTGKLTVLENLAEGCGMMQTVLPPETYVPNPATGLWHRLTAAVDEFGNITINVDENGVRK